MAADESVAGKDQPVAADASAGRPGRRDRRRKGDGGEKEAATGKKDAANCEGPAEAGGVLHPALLR